MNSRRSIALGKLHASGCSVLRSCSSSVLRSEVQVRGSETYDAWYKSRVRLAVVSDIHANLTALEAVVSDLKHLGPDMVVHGGDLIGSGARPAEVVDRIRALNWPGVQGNAEEMLWNPARVEEHFRALDLRHWRQVVDRTIAATIEAIGDNRLDWLRALPGQWVSQDVTIVHAGVSDFWRSPIADATDDELMTAYGSLGTPHVVYGHIHCAYVRQLQSFTVANSGSVSLSYDGDPRAAYVLIDDRQITIRRVEYDIEREVKALFETRCPDAAWLAEVLRTGKPLPAPVAHRDQ
jgi:putative phosphoesterase